MTVVDASLAAKWMIREADSAAALRFLKDHEGILVAPELFFVEVAAAIVRRANERTTTRAAASLAIAKWTVARATRVVRAYEVSEARLTAASLLALDMGHPLKDCVYLALAVELACDLATADARFAAKAVRYWPHVRLLDDYAAH